MFIRVLPFLLLAAGALTSLLGCITSEEAGPGDRARSPQLIPSRVDSIRSAARQDSLAQARSDSAKLAAQKRSAPRFRTKQDTVRASMVRKQKSAPRISIPIIRPENPLYTVQVGAFARASNALRTQKTAKLRFPDHQVINAFVQSARLYRVSVGRFEDRKSADRFRRELIEQYPNEYAQCWVNYIQR